MEQITLDSFTTSDKPEGKPSVADIRFTGDPFVDMGRLVMDTLRQKTVEEKIRFVTDVYVDRWNGKLNSIFLNSKMTSGHVVGKPEVQRMDTLEYYLEILGEKDYVSKGYCRICANKGTLFEGGRHNYPMVGSGEFTNFYHFQESSLLICKNCLIKLYFLPLGLLQCGGKLMLFQIQSSYAEKLWQKDVILENLDKISRGSSEGILKSNYLNGNNALFKFAADMIEKFKLYDHASQRITLFYFTNFAAEPDVQIYDLPNPIFSFLKRVLKPDLKADWMYVVKKHYHFGKTNYRFDENSQEWIEVKKKIETPLNAEDYEGTRRNIIYDRLLSGESILGMLRKVHKSRQLHVHIAITYLKEVRNMRQEQIDLIRKISDKIVAMCQKEGNYKKLMTPIEGAKQSYELRGAILRMAKAYLQNGEAEPFVRSKDYVEYLFPDGQSWYETRDFLLICLYEKLHDLRVEPDQVSDTDVADVEEIGENPEDFNQ
ncbi:MAG: type I-B CRISPR-associated protein Cas8b1/Cst1 [Desulfobacteraceae bacterium IS3]|nr:MAG: type I-B CRISPR-associated protein Cas8b1/Cst1 [Desulfobacteraceae bacterium IS3]